MKSVRVWAFISILGSLWLSQRNPVITQGSSPPVLLVTSASSPNPFGAYLGEILRGEGIASFASADIASLTAQSLSSVRLVVLTEMPLTASQALLLQTFVADGGRLVAMRPDAKLAGTLGIAPAGAAIAGYIGLEQTSPSGAGFTTATLPFRGWADRYTLAQGASVVATLYSDATTATAYPAIVRFNGTATWTFDLARSIALTRQGNPSDAGIDRDGEMPIRTNDLFYQRIDLNRVRLPYADIHMRVLGRVIADLLGDVVPLPRLWYFPNAVRALFVTTGDMHAYIASTIGTDYANAVQAHGGRATMYLSTYQVVPTATELAQLRAAGHEAGYHPRGYELSVDLAQAFQLVATTFTQQGWDPPSRTTRIHQLEWTDWTGPAALEQARGIGLDVTFYTWGKAVMYDPSNPSTSPQAYGYINGSGLPLRFVTATGQLLDVRQQTTSLIDEQLVLSALNSQRLSPDAALAVSRLVIDDSVSSGHTAVVGQFHVDQFPLPEASAWMFGTLDYAVSKGLPLWTAEHWLRYTEARAATQINNVAWVAPHLTFGVNVEGTEPQSVALPATFGLFSFVNVAIDGALAGSVQQAIAGRQTAFFNVPPGAHTIDASYGLSTGCSYGLTPQSSMVVPAGASKAVSVTTSDALCGWTATPHASWVTVMSGGSGVGPGTVNYNVANNGGSFRTTTMSIGSASHLIVQPAQASANDADGDGLPDDWEIRFGLNPQSAAGNDGPLGDPDGDSMTNLQEYQAGTHPRGFYTRYLAEGAAGAFFDTDIALLNTETSASATLLRFLSPAGAAASYFLSIPGTTRRSVSAEAVPGLTATEFATVIESDRLLVVDRIMKWDASGYGSHAETAMTNPALTWYLAEGATHSGFQLFYLLMNPQATTAQVTVRYLRPSGAAFELPYVLPANSRLNIWVNREDARLASTDVSAVIRVTNGVPILVERAMYLGDQPLFMAGHESSGVTSPATTWYFAEGATGSYFDTFILLANPNAADANVTAHYLLPSGATIVKSYTVPGNSRQTIWVDLEGPSLADTAVSTIVESTNGVPIVAERAMWWPGPTPTTWFESHNSAGSTTSGTKWAFAGGEVGGTANQATYVLISNNGSTTGTVQVHLYPESGAPLERTFTLLPQSRLNVDVGYEFRAGLTGINLAATPYRFGAVLESQGAQPASISVEWSGYGDAQGVHWAAGTNALAVRLSP